MRMWMVDPKIMCNQHLIGEHCELHMFVGSLKKNIKMDGYVKNNLLEYKSIPYRHNKLVKEMERRGMCHNSKLDIVICEKDIDDIVWNSEVNRQDALKELIKRCPECAKRYKVDLKKRNDFGEFGDY